MVKLKRLQRSFRFALKGIKTVFKTEQNFRLQLLVALIVVVFGIYFQLKPWEWVVIILLILFVLVLEMLNTAFERLVDMLQPRVHVFAHDIKNIMSSVVLITVISAVIIGLFIFGSRFF
ncbi:diacylglycerol kinase [Candidatus Falkowbacteria bacterium CG10_big_fil_rev_8_21_14_0_10_39_11]|uniref:Diacylglycerol kinase n=1 Tax=Candidatus Falkowbacteria bacterium CG10_big_fil_rev_8_21_14_0_10_39_11 TaxID=1974565 RepID=A0A2H0V584_9BACT|nr:MAG: diacylglycerol kinase [Candidatus Falkowbacteria bacterium CG10_big_fil_rev_8_21_14_0_10_39_11]